MNNYLRVVRSSGMYCKYLSKRPLLIFLRSFLSFQGPAQRDSQLFWRSWAQSLWWSFCHMDVTLVELILMTSDQGLLVIHLPSLHRVGMATAAGLSYLSWMHCYIPFEWCMFWKMEVHCFATYICMYWVLQSCTKLFQHCWKPLSGIQTIKTMLHYNENRHIWRCDFFCLSHSP